jgi:hypothetical protein
MMMRKSKEIPNSAPKMNNDEDKKRRRSKMRKYVKVAKE